MIKKSTSIQWKFLTRNETVQEFQNSLTFSSFDYVFIDLPWGQNCHVLIYQTAIINHQGYVAHLHATLRARRENTLPHQSKNILNDTASKVKKNID